MLDRRYFYYVSSFKPMQSVEAFVFFFARYVQVKHYVLNGYAWFAEVFMPFVEVFDNGFLKLAATPSCVANKNDYGLNKGLLVCFPSTGFSHSPPPPVFTASFHLNVCSPVRTKTLFSGN